MRKGRMQYWAAAAILVAGTIVLACATPVVPEPTAAVADAGASDAGDGLALIQARCDRHHNLARVEAASKTPEEWLQTVERMVGKGAELSADEQGIVVDYLAETYGP